MALQATMRRFEVNLAHADKEQYEELDLRVAQHPSESERSHAFGQQQLQAARRDDLEK